LYSLAEVQNKIRQILTKYRYDDCNLVADYDDGSKGVMQKSVIGTPTPYEFEGITVMGVEHYDTYLTNKYGDYMTIPDGNHQHQHNFHYLNLEMPYKAYREQTR
jgi:lipopolysaccharide cholinephosphotransferase